MAFLVWVEFSVYGVQFECCGSVVHTLIGRYVYGEQRSSPHRISLKVESHWLQCILWLQLHQQRSLLRLQDLRAYLLSFALFRFL
ncbi:hypothetical protein BTO19_25130 [Vibrio parahaemolyticus]|nr:hypothetical protein BTO19_25130 [Vibrio parahaemolyticus]TOQ36755.1 hypothetical protein CGG96_24595 [Vibrio parahaemolyticus]TOQ56241.1 hypothetical protein CGG92_24845 [Vibrio parahaemolyticus]